MNENSGKSAGGELPSQTWNVVALCVGLCALGVVVYAVGFVLDAPVVVRVACFAASLTLVGFMLVTTVRDIVHTSKLDKSRV